MSTNPQLRLPRHAFLELVDEALQSLPKEFRKALKNIAIVVEETAPPDEKAELGLRENDLLFGLYQGVPLPQRSLYDTGLIPDKITLYQKDIEAVCSTPEEIREQVYKTVLHEIGHYFGLDEDRLHELGYG